MNLAFRNAEWKDTLLILLTDYENHMSLDSIMQLQAMSEMIKCKLLFIPFLV